MNWDNMKIFLAIANAKGLKKAALRLGIHHTSCARRINSFEKELGVTLFDRLPAGYLLTEAGQELKISAQVIQQEFNGIEQHLLGKDLRIEGDLCLTLPNGFATHLLMPDLHIFMQQYPDINLKINMTYQTKDLASREADVAIRHVDNPPDSLTGKRVAQVYKNAYASQQYLNQHDLIQLPESCCWLGWGDSSKHLSWAMKNKYPKIPVRADMYSDVLQLAAAEIHMGIASLPCFMGDKSEILKRIDNAKPVEPEWIWVLAHKNMYRNARVKVLIDFLAKAFAKHKDTLEGNN